MGEAVHAVSFEADGGFTPVEVGGWDYTIHHRPCQPFTACLLRRLYLRCRLRRVEPSGLKEGWEMQTAGHPEDRLRLQLYLRYCKKWASIR